MGMLSINMLAKSIDLSDFILWEKGNLELNSELREKIILNFLPLVRSIALRTTHRLPSYIQADDLISAGILGLIDAVNKFDSTHNASFKTYAGSRIYGSILDELRNMDWAPRSIRKSTRKLEQAIADIEKDLLRFPTDEEIAEHMCVSVEDVCRMLRDASSTTLFSLDEDMKHGSGSIKENVSADIKNDPLLFLNIKEIKRIVKETIDSLPQKEKFVLSLYYFDELTMKEIGKVLGITEGRVCQIHGKAIIKMKTKLSYYIE